MRIDTVERFLSDVATPFLAFSGAALHLYTVVVIFDLLHPKYLGFLAAIGVWVTPGPSQFVVAYYTWSVTGSKLNYYTVWLLAWLVLLTLVMLFAKLVKRFGAFRP